MSGSGKSTLVFDLLQNALKHHFNKNWPSPIGMKSIEGLEHLDKFIDIDQSPIGRTRRSNPATYTGLFDPIRKIYAHTELSKIRGYKPGRFSFNVKGGRCEACKGEGQIHLEMNFLPDAHLTCDQCHGRRYNAETLEVLYQEKNIADVLELSVSEALSFFENHPSIRHTLQTLHNVGLGYIHLGQPANTLSGGEAQRLKLATELSKKQTGQTLYLLDEPTIGLHWQDLEKLIAILQQLVDQGNTVVVIEHNLDLIKCADFLLDLGPEGGEQGGRIVAADTPQAISSHPDSLTGQYLKPFFRHS
jgi:excinuclease ABC subunit A